jgi:hypothetical protein
MTLKGVGLALLAGLLMLAPLAANAAADGEDGSPGSDALRPDDAAWVDDCPPDMMCAMDRDDNATRGPEDCEYCRYGPDDCIDCSAPVDNTTWGTDCPPDVWCMNDGPVDEPPICEGGPCDYDPSGESNDPEAGEAPIGALVVIGFLLLIVVAFSDRHRRE